MSSSFRNSLILVLILVPPGAGAAENPPQFVDSWGTFGSEVGQFWYPHGLAVGTNCGCLYIAEVQNHRIQIFTLNGTPLDLWGGPDPGTGDGQFSAPSAVAVDGSGNVYVADKSNDRIQKFSSSGSFLLKFGSEGNTPGLFNEPSAIALSPNGDLYIVDNQNHRVQRFTTAGSYVSSWGEFGTANNQFRYPGGIAVDPSGNVFVSDSANNRIQKFQANGAFVAVIVGGTQLSNPLHLAADASGNIYVADHNNDRVRKYSGTGELLTTWGSPGQGDGEFVESNGVVLAEDGSIFVSDNYNRVQKFTTIVPVEPTTWGRIKTLYPSVRPGP